VYANRYGALVMQNRFEILLIEDCAADIRLICDAMSTGVMPKNISVVTNGEDALRYLERAEPYCQAPEPDVILLDLNLPRIDGRQLLEKIKSDRRLRHIPVVILTTSNAEADVQNCYEKHANCYLRKPSNLDEFLDLIWQLENYWLNLVALPTL